MGAKRMAPYQVFFPIGVLNALLAVGVWFVQDLSWFTTPSIWIHSRLIVGGFLWSFITGFLMTAVPKMTGTTSANKFEYAIALVLMFLLTMSSWLLDARPFFLIHIFLVLFLIFFLVRRAVVSQKKVPIFFSHIVLAMILALWGAYFHYCGNTPMGIHLFQVGAILLLVLGIGTRFFSFLSGLPSEFESEESRWKRFLFHVCGISMGALLYAAGMGFGSAYLFLTLVSLIYIFIIWKVWRESARSSALKWGVRMVALVIPLSFLLSWWNPLMYVTWFHLLFIGGFGVITFSVATRVTLAHGSYSTEEETKDRSLWWMVGFLALGILARVAYGYSYDLWWKKSWLHIAGTFWFFAVLIWSYSYLSKIFKQGPQHKPSC